MPQDGRPSVEVPCCCQIFLLLPEPRLRENWQWCFYKHLWWTWKLHTVHFAVNLLLSMVIAWPLDNSAQWEMGRAADWNTEGMVFSVVKLKGHSGVWPWVVMADWKAEEEYEFWLESWEKEQVSIYHSLCLYSQKIPTKLLCKDKCLKIWGQYTKPLSLESNLSATCCEQKFWYVPL